MSTTAPAPAGSDWSAVRAAILGNRLNLLLLLLPVAFVLEYVHAGPVPVFVASALSVVPLAGLIGHATEEIAHRVGPGLGGFLNATFGNGAELLIGALALRHGLVDVVKASLSGAIIGNILLVLGLAILVGGWGRTKQTFSRAGAGAQSLMLFLAVVGLAMPAIYDMSVLGSLTASSPQLNLLSLLSAIVLLLAYVAGLFFSLKTHKDVFSAHGEPTALGSPSAKVVDEHAAAAGHRPAPPMSTRTAMILLIGATALTAVAAEVLVASVEEASHQIGLSDLFVGMIVVAIVGNAAEHFSAVLVARNGNMQLAINIAKESSVQLALLAAPLLVLLSWALGTPMNLVFHPFELFGIALAVGAVTLVSLDGESHWYEGVLLLAVYVLLGIAVFFVPNLPG